MELIALALKFLRNFLSFLLISFQLTVQLINPFGLMLNAWCRNTRLLLFPSFCNLVSATLITQDWCNSADWLRFHLKVQTIEHNAGRIGPWLDWPLQHIDPLACNPLKARRQAKNVLRVVRHCSLLAPDPRGHLLSCLCLLYDFVLNGFPLAECFLLFFLFRYVMHRHLILLNVWGFEKDRYRILVI